MIARFVIAPMLIWASASLNFAWGLMGRRCRACHKRHQARYVGKTPTAMAAAADKLGEAMG